MSVLEERYRSLLRLLPASYRDVWEEEMVATFLETMARDEPDEAEYLADFGRPSLGEAASVVSLAARLRLGGVEAPPRAYAWGQAVRLVALVGLLVNAVIGSAGIAMALWDAGRIPLLPGPGSELAAAPSPTPWDVVLMVAGVVWAGAYVATVLERRPLAQMLAALAFVPYLTTAVWVTGALAVGREPVNAHLMSAWCVVLIDAAVVAALMGFHPEAPPVKRRSWLIAGAIGMTLVPIAATLLVVQSFERGVLIDWPGICCVAVVAAVVVHAVGGDTTVWSMALSLLALGVLVLRLVSLLDYSWHGTLGWGSAGMTVGTLEAAAVLGAGMWVARVASRAWRSLPHAAGG